MKLSAKGESVRNGKGITLHTNDTVWIITEHVSETGQTFPLSRIFLSPMDAWKHIVRLIHDIKQAAILTRCGEIVRAPFYSKDGPTIRDWLKYSNTKEFRDRFLPITIDVPHKFTDVKKVNLSVAIRVPALAGKDSITYTFCIHSCLV
jgi:hypothetical protein